MKYDQLVVCQGCEYNEKDKESIEEMFKKHGFHKPKIVGVVETTLGRKDFFFFVNDKDLNKFSIWRLQYSMRWWEDIFYNNEENEYPDEFKKKYPKRW